MLMIPIESLFERTLLTANIFDKRFINYVHRDIRSFAESAVRDTEVLCFPRMHPHYRYLIQVVAALFSLVTSEMGVGEYRTTIVLTSKLAKDKINLRQQVYKYCTTHTVKPFYKPYQKWFDFIKKQ